MLRPRVPPGRERQAAHRGRAGALRRIPKSPTMKGPYMRTLSVMVAAACLAAGLSACSSQDKAKSSPAPAAAAATGPLTVEDSVDVNVSAKVKAIDPVTR